MAALRVSVPGLPTRLVDLGPSVGRRTMTRGAVYGGVIVVGVSERQRQRQLEREHRLRQVAYYGDDTHGKDPDNGGVKPTEYRGLR